MGLFSNTQPPVPPLEEPPQRLPATAAQPPQSSLPQDRRGTTEQEAAMARQMGRTIEDTHKLAGQAVSLLADMAAPEEGTSPAQELVDTVAELLTAVREMQATQAEHGRALTALLRQPRA